MRNSFGGISKWRAKEQTQRHLLEEKVRENIRNGSGSDWQKMDLFELLRPLCYPDSFIVTEDLVRSLLFARDAHPFNQAQVDVIEQAWRRGVESGGEALKALKKYAKSKTQIGIEKMWS